MKPHKHAEILRAIADGKEVEFKGTSNIWRDPINTGMNPITFLDIEWRIKPEPKPDVVMYFSEGFLHRYGQKTQMCANDVKVTWDGETGKLKSAEVLNA